MSFINFTTIRFPIFCSDFENYFTYSSSIFSVICVIVLSVYRLNNGDYEMRMVIYMSPSLWRFECSNYISKLLNNKTGWYMWSYILWKIKVLRAYSRITRLSVAYLNTKSHYAIILHFDGIHKNRVFMLVITLFFHESWRK